MLIVHNDLLYGVNFVFSVDIIEEQMFMFVVHKCELHTETKFTGCNYSCFLVTRNVSEDAKTKRGQVTLGANSEKWQKHYVLCFTHSCCVFKCLLRML